MKASIVITTKDRKNDLRRAITSAMRQTTPVEIVVLDDGSSDGTAHMVRSEFPCVRLDETPRSLGLVAQRNRGALLCSGDIIFSLDDDAEFSTSRVVEQTLVEFSHPRIAAVAIPYVEPQKTTQHSKQAPNANSIWITDTFRGTAYALRRDIFLELGGYREQIVHQGEEVDFCIRLLNRGLLVRLGRADIIIHNESPKRDWARQDFYGRCNDILFAWRNIPMPFFLPHLLATTINGLRHAIATRSYSDLRGLLSGYSQILSHWNCREPVSLNVYRVHRSLKKRRPKMLSEVEAMLPSLKSTSPGFLHTAAKFDNGM